MLITLIREGIFLCLLVQSIMKKIKQIEANGFYIFRGEVAANGNFIESLDEAKQFLVYANYFLKDYVSVYEFIITRHEWHMIVKLKSKNKILAMKQGEDIFQSELEVWRVVSERVRLFLSQYVRSVNRMRGRTGTLVHSSYERYYFDTLSQAKMVIQRIRDQTFRFYKRKKRYIGMKKHYKIPSKLGAGSIFLCSKEVREKVNKGRNLLENQCFQELRDLVLSKFVRSTKNLHKYSSRPRSYPKLE